MVYKFLKNLQAVVLKMKLNEMNNWLKNHINQLLKNSKEEKYIHNLNTILGVFI